MMTMTNGMKVALSREFYKLYRESIGTFGVPREMLNLMSDIHRAYRVYPIYTKSTNPSTFAKFVTEKQIEDGDIYPPIRFDNNFCEIEIADVYAGRVLPNFTTYRIRCNKSASRKTKKTTYAYSADIYIDDGWHVSTQTIVSDRPLTAREIARRAREIEKGEVGRHVDCGHVY